MAALSAYHILHGLNTAPFIDERLSLYLKSLKLQAPLAPSMSFLPSSLDIQLLTLILSACDLMKFTIIFKPFYLLRFISFVTLSNIPLYSVAAFEHTRQLVRPDYISTAECAVLVIKWSNTLQNR